MANYVSLRTNFFVDEYRVPKYRGSCSPIEELNEEEVVIVAIFDYDDDNDCDYSNIGLKNDFSNLASCITDSEVDSKDRI